MKEKSLKMENYSIDRGKDREYYYNKQILGGMAMCTLSQLNSISEQMVCCYREVYGGDVVAIFLYGSYARGDYDEESDIDMTAIVRGERLELQQKLREIWDKSAEIGLENDVVVSPTVIPYDEFEFYKDKLPYYINLCREGKKIG